MKTFAISDFLYINVYYMGTRILKLALSGIDSQAALMRSLRSKLGDYSDKMLTLETRNATQGWSKTMPVLFAA